MNRVNYVGEKIKVLFNKYLSDELSEELINSIYFVSKELIKISYNNIKPNVITNNLLNTNYNSTLNSTLNLNSNSNSNLENNNINNNSIKENINENNLNNNNDIINSTMLSLKNNCSYELGNQSEELIYNKLLNDFPNMFIEKKSNISHCCDIHITDENNKILYMVELKYKQTITKEDITKFDFDLENYKSNDYKIIGIFISLNSKNIPFKINSDSNIKIENNKIYMINYNKFLLELIFNTWYLFIIDNIKNKEINNIELNNKEVIKKYIYSDYYNSILTGKDNIKIIDELINNLDSSKKYLENIKNKILLSIDKYNVNKDEISDIINLNKSFADSIITNKIKEMTDAIKTIPYSKITKKYLISLYPELENYIKSKTVRELLN